MRRNHTTAADAHARRLPPLAVAAALVLLPWTAPAQTLCSAPVAPSCVEAETTWQDDSAIARCRDDLDRFSAAADDHIACLGRQADELAAQRDAMEEGFSCRAEGGTDCATVSTLPGG